MTEGFATPDFSATRLLPEIELSRRGKHSGWFGLVHSDNANPLGIYPIPALCIAGRPGPTVLLTAGVHGDEYEGPAALMRLFEALSDADITGRLIILPQLNAPACRAGTRVSPLDGGNLNRLCPGSAEGTPTEQIAHLLCHVLFPVADAVIDLHSGGAASWFVPCALAARRPDGGLDAANMAMAAAFGTKTVWVLGAANDSRSVNGAATAAGLPCIAAELGGGGSVGLAALGAAEAGLRGTLAHLGVLAEGPAPCREQKCVELAGPGYRVVAPERGLFVPSVEAGESVSAGTPLGELRFPDTPARPALPILATVSGLILAETRRAAVLQGDFLMFVAPEIPESGPGEGATP